VLNTYDNMAQLRGSRSIRLSCSCDREDWFAFVYPAREYDIYLCPGFWRAEMTGRDSKAGTMIHELTHFPSIGGTSDHAYSTEVLTLPPDLAVDNADNYEYFAENVPELPIFNGVVFSWLGVDAAVSGNLRTRQSSFYKVTNAGLITLLSDSGDADLYVYSTPAVNNYICRSLLASERDECVLRRESVSYIEVFAVSDANYRLIANNNAPVVTVQADRSNTEDSGIGALSGNGLLFMLMLVALRASRRPYPMYG